MQSRSLHHALERFYYLLFASLLIAGCGGSAKRSADLLYDVRAYNEGLRWDKLPQAAVRIHPKERDGFLDRREDLQKELRIDDFEITRLTMTGKRQEKARVQIKWTWHMDSQGIVYTTTSKQLWHRFGKRWLMLEEAHVRGDQMPGVGDEDKTKDKDEDPESEGTEPSESIVRDPEASARSDITRSRRTRLKSVAYDDVRATLHAAPKTNKIAE